MSRFTNSRAGLLLVLFITMFCVFFVLPFRFDLFSADFNVCEFLSRYGFDCSDESSPTVQFSARPADPGIRCDGKDLVIAFQFDQPVSGEFELDWEDNSGVNTLTAIAVENTVLSFWFVDVPPDYGDNSIRSVWLIFNDGTQAGNRIYDQTYDSGELHWDACPSQVQEQPTLSNVENLEIQNTLTPTTTPNPDGVPIVFNSFCVGGKTKQLMVVFQFEKEVIGEYMAFVADVPYQLAPVKDQPQRLFFFGTPPLEGPVKIRLVSVPDLGILFEDTYTPVVCGSPRKKPEDKNDNYQVPGE